MNYHILQILMPTGSNVEESMKEQEISVQDIAELATSLSWLSGITRAYW